MQMDGGKAVLCVLQGAVQSFRNKVNVLIKHMRKNNGSDKV